MSPADLAAIVPSRPGGSPQPVGGGCIHRCFRWGPYFIKTNSPSHAAHFQAEAEGLDAIRRTGTIRTPEVIASGAHTDFCYLVLEALDLHPSGDYSILGEKLAHLHLVSCQQFGWPSDNFIGATPQRNGWLSSWVEFFRERRLGPLFDELQRQGHQLRGADRLLARLDDLLPEPPCGSLLHGDLWSGNKAFLSNGLPVIFDPAAYYGDPLADIAMTRLFGGFSPAMETAYFATSGRTTPPSEVLDLLNLYHLLNHALLFGSSYLNQAQCTISCLI